jgi:hypothetical protein
MGIEAKFTRSDVKKAYDNFVDGIKRQQINRLQMLGEMCVNHARNVPMEQGFQDQTGNLRSSIGYMVFVDGVAVHSMFEQRKEGAQGVKAGEALAQRVGERNPQGVCLVVTAGMNYALYVESKGHDVITTAEHLAQRELPRMLEKLVSQIKDSTE